MTADSTMREQGPGGPARRDAAPPPDGSAALALVFGLITAAVAGIILALHLVANDWWLTTAALLVTGAVSGVIAYRHVLRRCHVRELYRLQVFEHIQLLDSANPPAGGVEFAPTPEPASREMFERIDAAARQLRLLREIEEGVHGLEALFDLSGRLAWISPSVERLTGQTQADCLAAQDAVSLLVHESDRGFYRKMAAQIAAGSRAEDFEMRLVRRDGSTGWVACHLRPLGGEDEALRGLRLSAEDIHARKETEYKLLETVAELRRSQALREHYLSRSKDERMRLTALLNVIRLGILFMDRDHRVLYYNRAMLDMWGFQPEENLIGVRDVVLHSRMAHLPADPEAFLAHVQERLGQRDNHDIGEIPLKDGRILTDATALVEGGPDNTDIGRVWIYEDVTEARQTAQRLVQLAERDPLTDLFNRRRFHEELDRALANARRKSGRTGLVMIDLDGFKPINDEFGHQAGDEVLVTLARTVGAMIRRDEIFFRLGGDEFAVLAPDTEVRALQELARRIVEAIAALRFEFDGRTISLTASLGIAVFPEHAGDAERLIAVADQAMYFSKSSGRNRWSIAGESPECDDNAQVGGSVESKLEEE